MKKILLVDDHRNIRTVMRLALRDIFEIEEAETSDAAWECIQKARPDGIILDVLMPGALNGFQLCERIKCDNALADMHVVLVTACGQVADQEMGRALGADGYFVKPFSPRALAGHLLTSLTTHPGREAA